MTTPRFPHDFWSKMRAPHYDASVEAGAVPRGDRFDPMAAFLKTHAVPESGGDAPALDQVAASEALRRADDAPADSDVPDPLHSDGSWRVVSDWRPGLGTTSQSLFIPEHYEAKYAYPILVWLTDDGVPCRLASLMTDVSTRNFFGLAFPIPRRPVQDLVPSAEGEPSFLLSALRDAVLTVRRQFHIHSERIYLAGFGEGAGWALQLVLERPDWFGGAAVLGGRVGSMKEALARFGNLQGKRVLLGVGGRDAAGSADELTDASTALHSAGVNVETQLYDATNNGSTAHILGQVNRWMIDGIASAT